MALPTHRASWNDVTVCQPSRCPDDCDAQEECVVAAVAEIGTVETNPVLGINLLGGDLDEWTETDLTEWEAYDADFVLCIGEFLIIGSYGEKAILRSDDRGANRVEITSALYGDWTAAPPTQIDAIDQTYILMCGDIGFIYVSYDAGRTWSTADAGLATDQDYTRIMIARDNPQVAYATTNLGVVTKTENGGETWFLVATVCEDDSILALDVKSQSDVLVLNNDGEMFQTEDGGLTWRIQETLPDMQSAPVYADIVHCGCEEFYAVSSDGSTFEIYRNVYGGASGFWYHPEGTDPALALRAIACCDSNRAVAVGGNDLLLGYIYLLA